VLTTGDFLDAPVRELMSPGVVAISEDASLDDVYTSLVVHRVHAILVVGAGHGTPLGWVTAQGLLAYADKDTALVSARDAVTEQPHAIRRSATAREAITALSRVDTTHLIVVDSDERFPVGTISDLDLAAFVAHS
jgi:CBS-domain-containing membrane protein